MKHRYQTVSASELSAAGCCHLVAAILHQACVDAVVPGRNMMAEARTFIYSAHSKHLAEQIGWRVWPPSEEELATFAQTRRANNYKKY